MKPVRVGDTIRRPLRRGSAAVHALLVHLEEAGFEGAPRFMGIDDEGREVLSWIEGDGGSPGGENDARLMSEARLVRDFHDAVSGWTPSEVAFELSIGDPGGGPLVCHNDLGPHNTVFRGDTAAAIIDWNEASPGSRPWDVAEAAWRAVPLYDPEWLPGRFIADAEKQARRLGLYADAYGLGTTDRAGLIEMMVRRLDRLVSYTAETSGRDGTHWRRNAAYLLRERARWDAALGL